MFDDPLTLLFICAMVFLSGLIDSIAGGGGLISLPAYLFIGIPPHIAYGCNKFGSACGTTLSVLRFFRYGVLDVKVALTAAGGAFIGSAIGSQIVLFLNEQTLKKFLLVLLPIAAFIILFKVRKTDERPVFDLPLKKRLIQAVFVGTALGMYDGIFGPGCGTFAILAFTGIMGYDLRTSSGNAKALNLASNYASTITFMAAGTVDYSLAIPAAISCIIGNYIGSGLAIHKGARFIRPTMILVIVLLMAKIIYDVVIGG